MYDVSHTHIMTSYNPPPSSSEYEFQSGDQVIAVCPLTERPENGTIVQTTPSARIAKVNFGRFELPNGRFAYSSPILNYEDMTLVNRAGLEPRGDYRKASHWLPPDWNRPTEYSPYD